MLKTRSFWRVVIISIALIAALWMWTGRGKTVPDGDLILPLSSSLPLFGDYHWADSDSLIAMYGIFGPEATIVQINLQTGERNTLASFRPPSSAAGVPWDRFRISGDNRRLALLPLPISSAVTFADINGQEPFDVTITGESVSDVVWAADNRHALVLGRAFPLTKLLLVDAKLGTQAHIEDFQTGDAMAIGSSGKEFLIGYIDTQWHKLELHSVDHEEKKLVFKRSIPAPNPNYDNWEARLSPNGSRIAWLGCRAVRVSNWIDRLRALFSGSNKSHYVSQCELWITDADGGNGNQLTSWREATPGANELKWLPNDRAVSFLATGGIWRVPID